MTTKEDTIALSEALPPEDRPKLTEGLEIAITGLLIEHKTNAKGPYKVAKINGLLLPNFDPFVKYKSSAAKVVEQCENLIAAGAIYQTGEAKKPIRVRVVGYDGMNGRGLVLEDA